MSGIDVMLSLTVFGFLLKLECEIIETISTPRDLDGIEKVILNQDCG